MTSTPRPTRTRSVRLLTIGVAASGLCLAGAGLAVATNAAGPAEPRPDLVAAYEAATEGADFSEMPADYTEEQYRSFWTSGYTAEDLSALKALWSVDETEAKARAGQALLDGAALPFAPGTHASTEPSAETLAEVDAFFAAGYTVDDVAQLAELWGTETVETKARAGQLLIDGQTVPVAPSGTPAGA